jgi:alkylation response protein AidB-like acyl-CoA dehydrogenase
MNLTEPDAGSDVGALRTKAEPRGDGTYAITGTKIFISFGEHDLAENIVHLVLARTPGAPPGTKGISCFIVPKVLEDGTRNAVTCVSIEHKMGIKASPTCVLEYDGATGYLIGDEHAGMRYMFTMMNNARLSVGLEGLSLGERAYQQAVAFSKERRQGRAPGAEPGTSSPIVEHPDVRRMLLTMRATVEAMRALAYTNAEAIDLARHHPDPDVRERAQERADLLTPVTKGWCTDMGVEVTSLAVQVHGGMGYVEETGVAQHFRDARITPIYEGTNGIQAMDLVGRKLPIRLGGAMQDLLGEVAGLDADLTAPELAPLQAPLADGVAALREATDWLLANGLANPVDALAGATPYLRLFGIVAGGWLLARSAVAACELLAGGEGDPAFLRDKLATARFYATQLLPAARGLVPAVTAGSADLFAIDEARL